MSDPAVPEAPPPAARAPRPQPCRAEDCPATIVFLPSFANPGRFVAATVGARPLRYFVLVRKDDPERLADQETIDAGRATARQVTVYPSHHARYAEVPACPGSARFRRSR
jgi:hypothetical protein